MGISFAEINVGSVLSGLGGLAKDIRTAITGEAPIDPNKRAELLQMAQQLEGELEKTRISVMIAEAQSQDKWTSRARPAFLYVVYIFILSAIPMGVVFAISPEVAGSVITGVKGWLAAIPADMWALMGAGYLGYTGVRGWEKGRGVAR